MAVSSQTMPAAELRKELESNATLRREIETLNKHFFGKPLSNCGDCFLDAYVKLYKLNNMVVSKFKVKAGALIYDPVNQDAGKILTAANCTDELALYHIKHNPNCRKFFSVLPDDAMPLK
jgi:hypothetical protein